jgi:hypothetical protein
MIRQAPEERYLSIREIKNAISVQRSEFLTLQKISKIDATVIPEGEVDEPLAHDPPKLVDKDWANGTLTLTLDRPVNQQWIHAFHNLNVSYPMGAHPTSIRFAGNVASVPAEPRWAQELIDYFKRWLPQATQALKETLQRDALIKADQLRERLRREKAAEEERLKVNLGLRI